LGQSCPGRGDGVSATSQPPQSSFSLREEFFRLYELYIANGITACVAIRSATGSQEILFSCRLRAPPSSTSAPIAQCCRRRCQRLRNTAMGDATNHVAAAAPARLCHWSPSPSCPSSRGPSSCHLIIRLDSPTPPVLSPLSTPTTSPMLWTPTPLSPLEQGPSTPFQATLEPSSPTAVPTDIFTPPPIALASPSAPEAADKYAETGAVHGDC
jgi:hypothetical protein